MFAANIFKSLLKLTAVLALTLLALPTASAWSIFGKPRNEQECMLQNLKGVNDKTVAQMIVVACEELFPIRNNTAACVQRELIPQEVQQLQWSTAEITQLSSGPYFSAKFYNGTQGATISAVTINIYVEPPDRDKKSFTFEEANSLEGRPQEYKMQLDGLTAPKEIGKVTKTVLKIPPKDWKWEITSVKACQ